MLKKFPCTLTRLRPKPWWSLTLKTQILIFIGIWPPPHNLAISQSTFHQNSTWKGQLKKVQEGISRPIGRREKRKSVYSFVGHPVLPQRFYLPLLHQLPHYLLQQALSLQVQLLLLSVLIFLLSLLLPLLLLYTATSWNTSIGIGKDFGWS